MEPTKTEEIVGLVAAQIGLVSIQTQMFGRDLEFTFCQKHPCPANSFTITLKNCKRIIWNIEVDEFDELWPPGSRQQTLTSSPEDSLRF